MRLLRVLSSVKVTSMHALCYSQSQSSSYISSMFSTLLHRNRTRWCSTENWSSTLLNVTSYILPVATMVTVGERRERPRDRRCIRARRRARRFLRAVTSKRRGMLRRGKGTALRGTIAHREAFRDAALLNCLMLAC